jgi:hypothetical protein
MQQDNFDSSPQSVDWHPAFIEALQMELMEYQNALEFHPEYPLTDEPLRIDCVVIKKVKNVIIKKNIASIFREWNIVEYKSPSDYVSIADFYKVYGYACLYTSFKRIPITDLTVSFIESRYPQKLLDHLKNTRNYTIAETGEGIYTVRGDILPIQVIDSRKLSKTENLWLKNLSDKLDYSAFRQINAEINRQDKAARIAAYLNVIVRANPAIVQEAIEMGDTVTIEKVLENVGWTAKWEARGRAEGEKYKAFDIAKNLVNLGVPIETVISATQLDPEKIKSLNN